MFDRFFRYFTYDLGVDLGTANTRILVLGKGIAVREPTVVARNKKSKEIVAVGTDARRMIGRTPSQLEAIHPLKEGAISDFDAVSGLLSFYFKQLHQSVGLKIKIPRPKVVISVSSGINDVEKKAAGDAALSAGARKVFLVESPMAAAIGANLPIFEANGALMVILGAGLTEVAIISLGGIVISKTLRIAGDKIDETIINFLRLKYSLLVGMPTAENLKTQIGSVADLRSKGDSEKMAIVRGRDLTTGLPSSIRITAAEIREAISPLVNQIASAISDVIEETPPELLGDITQRGIYLAGGVAQLPGFEKLVTETVKMPCTLLTDPMNVVVRGCGKLLEDEKLLQKVRLAGGAR